MLGVGWFLLFILTFNYIMHIMNMCILPHTVSLESVKSRLSFEVMLCHQKIVAVAETEIWQVG